MNYQSLAIENTSVDFGELPTGSGAISTDTRKIQKGDIFIALNGENFKGAQFIEEAIVKGARVLVVNKDEVGSASALIAESDVCLITVGDTTQYLQDLSQARLKEWRSTEGKNVIAITGSNGKTTTKEMVSFILNELFPNKVQATSGNLNNHLGVPLTVLSVEDDHDWLIVEMGTNHPGEIGFLAKLVQPDYAVITSIGASHLEFFGTVHEVLKEKSSLFHEVLNCSNKSPSCFYSALEEHLNEEFEDHDKVTTLGIPGDAFEIKKTTHQSFDLNTTEGAIHLHASKLLGIHNYQNLHLALGLVQAITQVDDFRMLARIANKFEPSEKRSVWEKRSGVNVFVDCYNANPTSMKAALDSFIDRVKNESKLEHALFVLGDMYELGEDSERFHQQIGKKLQTDGISHCRFVGKFAQQYADGFGKKCLTFEKTEDLVSPFRKEARSYKYIFIKGSRGVKLENLLSKKPSTK